MLLQSYQFLYDAGILTDTQREDIIILISEHNKDPLPTSSYRLITLSNIDCKIIATVINSRMNFYFNELIPPCQYTLIKRRYIGDNIRIFFDLIDLTIPEFIFTTDIFKAFDSLKWDFMFRVELKYCFGSIIVKWLKTFM